MKKEKSSIKKNQRENWSIDDPKDPKNWDYETRKKYNSVWARKYKDYILHDTTKLNHYDTCWEGWNVEHICKAYKIDLNDITLYELNDLLYSCQVETIKL